MAFLNFCLGFNLACATDLIVTTGGITHAILCKSNLNINFKTVSVCCVVLDAFIMQLFILSEEEIT